MEWPCLIHKEIWRDLLWGSKDCAAKVWGDPKVSPQFGLICLYWSQLLSIRPAFQNLWESHGQCLGRIVHAGNRLIFCTTFWGLVIWFTKCYPGAGAQASVSTTADKTQEWSDHLKLLSPLSCYEQQVLLSVGVGNCSTNNSSKH